jgi:hypothetical protein
MGTFSDAAKNTMLDGLSSPVYVQLHTGDPGSAGTSNVATETTRKSCGLAAASAGARVSNSQQQWTSYPAAETISWVSFWTAVSGGTFLGRDDLPASKTPAIGDTLTIASGDVSLSI